MGYIVMDESSSSVSDPEDTSVRVYTLAEDEEHTYLLEYDTSTTLMNQPYFWRAVDTRGADVPVPDCIDALEYAFWNAPD